MIIHIGSLAQMYRLFRLCQKDEYMPLKCQFYMKFS